jgi:hypothetical protein
MDDDRFDFLTASLATSPTRRGALGLLAAIVAGFAPLGSWAKRRSGNAKKRRQRRRKRKPSRKRRHKHKPRQCPAKTKRCNGKCIAQDGCCTSEQCGDGGVCDEQHACVCAPEYKNCGATCIQVSECCGDCHEGSTCQAGECVCASGFKVCGDGCIPDDECCDGCPMGMACEASACVCAPHHKTCGDICIPESDCCEGCPKGTICQEGACVCAPDSIVCGDTCIPDTQCCGGCPDGTRCEEGACVRNGTPLYPDLRTLAARDLTFDTLNDGIFILRFSNSIWNAGEGRLELQGDPNPQPDPNTVKKVYQNLYDAPIDGTLVSHKQVASDFIYHPTHHHFHLADFASYLLLAGDDRGVYHETTKRGTKTSFCLEDSNPIAGTYPPQYDTCGTDRQGITPGWADTYGYRLPDQWVVLGTESLSDGEYAVQSITDPRGLLAEGGGNRESNNASITYFTVLNGAIVNVRGRP